MKKETICKISVTCIWDIEVMALFVQSVRHIEKLIVPVLLILQLVNLAFCLLVQELENLRSSAIFQTPSSFTWIIIVQIRKLTAS